MNNAFKKASDFSALEIRLADPDKIRMVAW